MDTYTNEISTREASQALSQAANAMTVNEIGQMNASQALLNKQVAVSENMESYEQHYLKEMKGYMASYIAASVATLITTAAISYYAVGSEALTTGSGLRQIAADTMENGAMFAGAGANTAEAAYTMGAAKYKALESKAEAASDAYGELGKSLIDGPMQEDITGQAAVMGDAAGVISNNNAAKTSI